LAADAAHPACKVVDPRAVGFTLPAADVWTGKRSGHRASAGIAHSQDLNGIAFVSQEAGSLYLVPSVGAP